jgi:hypothetical protein
MLGCTPLEMLVALRETPTPKKNHLCVPAHTSHQSQMCGTASCCGPHTEAVAAAPRWGVWTPCKDLFAPLRACALVQYCTGSLYLAHNPTLSLYHKPLRAHLPTHSVTLSDHSEALPSASTEAPWLPLLGGVPPTPPPSQTCLQQQMQGARHRPQNQTQTHPAHQNVCVGADHMRTTICTSDCVTKCQPDLNRCSVSLLCRRTSQGHGGRASPCCLHDVNCQGLVQS